MYYSLPNCITLGTETTYRRRFKSVITDSNLKIYENLK